MTRHWLLPALLGCTLSLGHVAWAQTKAEDSSKGCCRVGTFKRRELLVAFYHSKYWDTQLKDLMAQRDKAKSLGDQKKVAELEAAGAALQEEAHRQLLGKAPLTNVLSQLKAELPAIAKEASVSLIVEEPLFQDKSVETVDITPLLIKRLPPVSRKSK
ncbi:MAG TPA: hypothetical protein VK395_30320 [Gemmataceae bacterium]|nr:hypothetical protein [Gemmataceae bacterium]